MFYEIIFYITRLSIKSKNVFIFFFFLSHIDSDSTAKKVKDKNWIASLKIVCWTVIVWDDFKEEQDVIIMVGDLNLNIVYRKY